MPSTRALDEVCRLVFGLRLAVLVLTALAAVSTRFSSRHEISIATVALVLVSFLASYVTLRDWHRLGPLLTQRPEILAGDVVLSSVVLSLAGPNSPFFLAAVSPAFLAALLRGIRAAALILLLELAGYAGVAAFLIRAGELSLDFYTIMGNPGLYALAAFVGVQLRRLFDTMGKMDRALLESEKRLAAAEERARLAREMHDSLSKTLHGIAISAVAVERCAQRDPQLAAERASHIAIAADRAASEARSLIAGLRRDSLNEPLTEALKHVVVGWSAGCGIPVTTRVDAVRADLDAGTRHNVLAILAEALANVERHAAAQSVDVSFQVRSKTLVLRVADDGLGFDANIDLSILQHRGHYGLVGMTERGRSLGGEVSILPRCPHGTEITLKAPISRPKTERLVS